MVHGSLEITDEMRGDRDRKTGDKVMHGHEVEGRYTMVSPTSLQCNYICSYVRAISYGLWSPNSVK